MPAEPGALALPEVDAPRRSAGAAWPPPAPVPARGDRPLRARRGGGPAARPAGPARAVAAGPLQAARVGGGGELEAPARHRPAGPRPALPHRVGLAGVARGGGAHGAGGERLRGRGRPDRRLLRRARRRGPDARHRRHHVLPGDPARADPGGHGGSELHQRGDRHRGDPVGALRARHPRPGAHPDAARLRGPGAHRGRRGRGGSSRATCCPTPSAPCWCWSRSRSAT